MYKINLHWMPTVLVKLMQVFKTRRTQLIYVQQLEVPGEIQLCFCEAFSKVIRSRDRDVISIALFFQWLRVSFGTRETWWTPSTFIGSISQLMCKNLHIHNGQTHIHPFASNCRFWENFSNLICIFMTACDCKLINLLTSPSCFLFGFNKWLNSPFHQLH